MSRARSSPPSVELDRSGWRLGAPQRSQGQVRRVPVVFNRTLAMWAYGVTEAEWVDHAQYLIDEYYVKRRLQLDELILQDDLNPLVRVLSR